MLKDLLVDNRLNLINIKSKRPMTIPQNRIIIDQICMNHKYFNRKDILYIITNKQKNIESKFICKCGNFKHYYLNYCSRKCSYFKESVVKKMEETNLKIRGVRNAGMMPDHKEKIHRTSQKKWGKNSFTQTDEYIKKSEDTCLKRYGNKVSSRSDIVKEKARNHFLNTFGETSYFKTEEFQIKRSDTMIERYGTDISCNIPEVREKMENTCLKNHGVKNYLASDHINKIRNNKEMQEKRYQTMKKNNSWGDKSGPEETIYFALKDTFPNLKRRYKTKLYPFPCDFYIPELDLFIECHFSQYHHYKPFDENSIDDLREVLLLKLQALKLRKERNNNELNQYDNMLQVWTDKDIRKLRYFKQNKLNFRIFYNYEQFLDWFMNFE